MININKSLLTIRCNKYQYLIKKGSMSNYSFDIIDENKSGILELLFEKISYPIDESAMKDEIRSKCKNITEEEICSYIKDLIEFEVFQSLKTESNKPIALITDKLGEKNLRKKLVDLNYSVKSILVSETGEELFIDQDTVLSDNNLEEILKDNEYILVVSKLFQPNLFYKINTLCIELDKKMIITYLDGDEGLIIPIMNPNKSGCYNDFEMLRESSFHNLLDYQVMKEKCINDQQLNKEYNQLYLEILIGQTILLINKYSKYSYINHYAYSFDFERMVNSKIRMLRFPKCPSCQGDTNLTHPFI